MRKEEIYRKALSKWGTGSQILMFFEEFCELGILLCHAMRTNKTVNQDYVTDELADVEIMLEQMAAMCSTPRNSILKIKEMKLKRLEGLVGK